MIDFLLGLTTAIMFMCLIVLGVLLLLVLKIMHGVQAVLDLAGASVEEDEPQPAQEQVTAPGAIPMPPSLRDRLRPLPPSTDLTNGTFGGRKPWTPPSDEPPAA